MIFPAQDAWLRSSKLALKAPETGIRKKKKQQKITQELHGKRRINMTLNREKFKLSVLRSWVKQERPKPTNSILQDTELPNQNSQARDRTKQSSNWKWQNQTATVLTAFNLAKEKSEDFTNNKKITTNNCSTRSIDRNQEYTFLNNDFFFKNPLIVATKYKNM